MKRTLKMILVILGVIILLTSLISCEWLAIPGFGEKVEKPSGTKPDPANCTHFYILGTCRFCGTSCSEHKWEMGICKICDLPCDHVTEPIHPRSICKICEIEYTKSDYEINVWHDVDASESKYYAGGTQQMDIDMTVNELCGRFLSTEFYILRHDILDVYIDGKLVTDFSQVVSKPSQIKFAVKESTILVHVQIISSKTSAEGERKTLFVPSYGVTLDFIGALLFPSSDGFAGLLQAADVEIDGTPITDPNYKIDKMCNLTLKMKDDSGPTYEDKEGMIIVSFTIYGGAEGYSKNTMYFSKLNPPTLSEAIKDLSGLKLDQLLHGGVITLDGQEVYDDLELWGPNHDIVFTELKAGMIKLTFTGIGDLGTPNYENKSIILESGTTYENAISKLLDMSWDEYSDQFFNTRIAIGPSTEWIPVYRDTVLDSSITVTAQKYKEHDKTGELTLQIDIKYPGVERGSVTVAYGTTLSDALRQYNDILDLDTLLEEADLFFNVYGVLSDFKLKYNSVIYGYKRCDEHSWQDRVCTLCGTTCSHVYYTDGACPVCGATHPTSQAPEGEYTLVLYIYDAEKVLLFEGEKYYQYGASLHKTLYLMGYDLYDMIADGTVTVDGENILDDVFLYQDAKIVYRITEPCLHEWDNGYCTRCHRKCTHSIVGQQCILCHLDFIKVEFTEVIYGEVTVSKTLDVIYGTCLSSVIYDLGYGYLDFEYGHIYLNGQNQGYDVDLYDDCSLSYVVKCNHTYDSNGFCTICKQECEHKCSTMIWHICRNCGVDITEYVKACEHTFDDIFLYCTKCGVYAHDVPTMITVTFRVMHYDKNTDVTYDPVDFKCGELLQNIIGAFGYDSMMIEKQSVYVNEAQIKDKTMQILTDSQIVLFISSKECVHTFDGDVCIWCYFKCMHKDHGDGICVICGNKIIYDTGCQHTWVGDTCTQCGSVCGHEYNDAGMCRYCGTDRIVVVTYNSVEYSLTPTTTLYEFIVAIVGQNFDHLDKDVGYWAYTEDDGPERMDRAENFGALGMDEVTLVFIHYNGIVCQENCPDGSCGT